MDLEAAVKQMCRAQGLDVPEQLVRLALQEARKIIADDPKAAQLQSKDDAHAFATTAIASPKFASVSRDMLRGAGVRPDQDVSKIV